MLGKERTIPLVKAVSSCRFIEDITEVPDETLGKYGITGVLQRHGFVRDYSFCEGDGVEFKLQKYGDKLYLNNVQRVELARLLDDLEDVRDLDPDMDFCEIRVAPYGTYMGQILADIPSVTGSGCWGGLDYGMSVFMEDSMQRGFVAPKDYKKILYIKYDGGRGGQERESYDCIVPLEANERRQLIEALRSFQDTSTKKKTSSRKKAIKK